MHRHVVALLLAGGDRRVGDGGRQGYRQVLVGEKLGVRRSGEAKGERGSKRQCCATRHNLGHTSSSLVKAAALGAAVEVILYLFFRICIGQSAVRSASSLGSLELPT